jgi:hypothetical protein
VHKIWVGYDAFNFEIITGAEPDLRCRRTAGWSCETTPAVIVEIRKIRDGMVKPEAHFCKFNCFSSEDFIRNLNRDRNIDRNYDKEAMRVARKGQYCALEFLDQAEQENIPVHKQKG